MQPKRKNIRLHGYDYSRAGLYFLTIVVQNRLHLFGHVDNGKMILNDAGQMIERWYHEIEHKYPDKQCREMVVMPNHFHCIIENVEMPMDMNAPSTDDCPLTDEKYGMHNKKYGATIGDVMDWFKTMTTNEYIRGVKNNNWERFDGKLWQRNYYDRIIRDGEEDVRITTYILENPEKWKEDKFNSIDQ